MTECNGCGSCCDPVHLPVSPADISAMIEAKRVNYGRRTASVKTLAWMAGLRLIGKVWTGTKMSYRYACPHFDRDTRRCTNYGMRPETCSNYPWYGREPNGADVSMGAHCSFLADVKTMLPIVEVR